MLDPRLREVLQLLRPAAGDRLWFGGATPTGSLRGVAPERAAWKPSPERHSIWALALHIAYWTYAVRRALEASPTGGFPRSPANWPTVPSDRDAAAWKTDRALLRLEQEKLVAVVEALDARRLDEAAPGRGTYRYMDLLHGVVMHDAYHVGQIQLLKRLVPGR